MALSLIATAKNGSITDGTTGCVVTHGMTLFDDDYLLAIVGAADDAQSAFASSGWTVVPSSYRGSSGGNDRAIAWLYKKITDAGSEPSSYTFTRTGDATTVAMGVIIHQIRGADGTTFIDAVTTPPSDTQNTMVPDAPDVTTATDDALVLTSDVIVNAGGAEAETMTFGAPSGLSLTDSLIVADASTGIDLFMCGAYVVAGTAGAQSVGAWTHSGGSGNWDHQLLTGAVREGATSSLTYWDEVDADSPTLSLDMDEASGNLTDRVAAKTGTANGSPTYQVAGPGPGIPYGITFPTGAYFSFADHADLDLGDGPFSIELWFKRHDAAVAGDLLGKCDNATTPGYQVVVTSTDRVNLRRGDSTDHIHSLAPVIDNTDWHHLVVTRGSGTTGAVYIDGAEASTSESAAVTFTDSANALTIGRRSSGTGSFLGSIAAVALYKSALSAGRIAAHYAAAFTGGSPPSAEGPDFDGGGWWG